VIERITHRTEDGRVKWEQDPSLQPQSPGMRRAGPG
jgi:hypothetical protein